jgi:molybdopterin converting factor small subunit
MKIELLYTAQLAMEAGGASETLEIEHGASIDTLIRHLAESRGGKFAQLLLNDQGDPHPTIMRIVNGEQVDRAHPPKLEDGDELMLMSPIAGG